MSWTAFAQTASTFVTGQFGIMIITLWIGISAIRVGIEHRWSPLFHAIFGGVGLFSAAWTVQTFMQG